MARFYANENFPAPVARSLRELGHDVLTMDEAGTSGRSVPDDVVLEQARADQRAILTLNRKHFIRLHRDRPDHAGIVVCTFDPDFTGQAYRINAAVADLDLAGHLVRVNRVPG